MTLKEMIDMGLNEKARVSGQKDCGHDILRVPEGWIYFSEEYAGSGVFVPLPSGGVIVKDVDYLTDQSKVMRESVS